MDKKKIISLTIIAILAIFLVVKKYANFSGLQETVKWENPDEILIKSKAETVRIYKKDSKWVINDEAYPASEAAVQSVVSKLQEFKLAEVITDKPYYDKYDLGDESGVEVTVTKSDKTVLNAVIGKKSSAGSKVYAKNKSENAVYLADGISQTDLNKGLNNWREKKIYSVNKDIVAKFMIQYGTENSVYKKTEKKVETMSDSKPEESTEKAVSEWELEGSSVKMNQELLSDILGEITNVFAASFLDTPNTEKEILRVIITAEKEYILDIIKKDSDGKYICRTPESPYTFKMEPYKVEKFMKKAEDIKMK